MESARFEAASEAPAHDEIRQAGGPQPLARESDLLDLTPAGVLALQRSAGNAAVTRLLQRRECAPEQGAWERRGTAARLIRDYNFLGIPAWLRMNDLARHLLGRLPRDADVAHEIIDQLVQGHWDSDMAVALCANASDEQLLRIGRDECGMRLLFRCVRAMQGITTSDAEKRQLYRAMTAITRARSAVPIGVEVITFRTGVAPLDWAGERLFGTGARGHTAVVVADLVYSFDERGWVMEGSKSAYLARNTHRDGIGHVLRVRPDDAARIQDRLNRSVGHGVYLFSGQVCTDASAAALERVLGQVDARHNPQRFAEMLERSGHVERTNQYARARR